MKKITQFAIVFVISITSLVILLYLLNLSYQEQASMNFAPNMMNHMMGGVMGNIESTPIIPFYLSLFTPVSTLLLLIGLCGIIYFIIVPEISLTSQGKPNFIIKKSTNLTTNEKLDTVKKMMKPDEKKVLEALYLHNGKFLQKHISKEANISRLKTHRIIAGFVQRGIVTVRPYGNTNEVSISDWLLPEEYKKEK